MLEVSLERKSDTLPYDSDCAACLPVVIVIGAEKVLFLSDKVADVGGYDHSALLDHQFQLVSSNSRDGSTSFSAGFWLVIYCRSGRFFVNVPCLEGNAPHARMWRNEISPSTCHRCKTCKGTPYPRGCLVCLETTCVKCWDTAPIGHALLLVPEMF